MRLTSLSYGPVDPKGWPPASIVREVMVTLVTSADVESGRSRTHNSTKRQRRIAITSRAIPFYRGKRETIGETINLSNDGAGSRASSGGRAAARAPIGVVACRRRRGYAAHCARRHTPDRH